MTFLKKSNPFNRREIRIPEHFVLKKFHKKWMKFKCFIVLSITFQKSINNQIFKLIFETFKLHIQNCIFLGQYVPLLCFFIFYHFSLNFLNFYFSPFFANILAIFATFYNFLSIFTSFCRNCFINFSLITRLVMRLLNEIQVNSY